MSLYDKELERERKESRLAAWRADLLMPGISPLWEANCLEEIARLERELGILPQGEKATPCECGAEKAGFTTHTHWCPKDIPNEPA